MDDVKEPTTDNVIKQTEGYPSLIEAARVAREAASAILSRTEPMTEEIVKGLRNCANADNPCTSECINLDMAGGCRDKMMNDAADRLESQQREIAKLTAERDAEKARADAMERGIERLSAEIKTKDELIDFATESMESGANKLLKFGMENADLTAKLAAETARADAANERVTDYELSSRGF